MPKYYVKMKIDFSGEIEADSEKHAEELAWDKWGADSDAEIQYDGVYSIDADHVADKCEECEEWEDECNCEDEEEEE